VFSFLQWLFFRHPIFEDLHYCTKRVFSFKNLLQPGPHTWLQFPVVQWTLQRKEQQDEERPTSCTAERPHGQDFSSNQETVSDEIAAPRFLGLRPGGPSPLTAGGRRPPPPVSCASPRGSAHLQRAVPQKPGPHPSHSFLQPLDLFGRHLLQDVRQLRHVLIGHPDGEVGPVEILALPRLHDVVLHTNQRGNQT
jgi:hypothetical protein